MLNPLTKFERPGSPSEFTETINQPNILNQAFLGMN